MERAVVHEVKDDGVAVFVPRFHVRGVVRLLRRARDGRGLIGVKNGNSVITDDDTSAVLPALDTSFETVADTSRSWMRLEPAPEGTPGITLERKGESLGWTYSASYGQTLSRALPPLPKPLRVLQPVWVQLSCERSAARGPTLVTTLLDETHPSVAVAKRKSEVETPTKDAMNTYGQLSASPSASARVDSREVDELARGARGELQDELAQGARGGVQPRCVSLGFENEPHKPRCYGTRSPLRGNDPYHRFHFSVPDGAWSCY